MICPYCSEPMKMGHIPSRKEDLCWIPEGEKSSWLMVNSPNSLTLALFDVFGCKAEAYYCEPCRKIILDVPEQLERLTSSPYKF